MTTLCREGLSPDQLERARQLIEGRSRASKKAARSFKKARQGAALTRVTFQLPLMPVPLHACFINKKHGRGRYESPRYTTWKDQTDAYVRGLYHEHLNDGPIIPGQVRVRYFVKRPDNRKRDLDNMLKALNDTLTRLGVIEDDSCIVDLGIAWTESRDVEAVLVEVEGVDVGAGVIREVA
jgi:Holliday junction resolvase RusA-like endonuclease